MRSCNQQYSKFLLKLRNYWWRTKEFILTWAPAPWDHTFVCCNVYHINSLAIWPIAQRMRRKKIHVCTHISRDFKVKQDMKSHKCSNSKDYEDYKHTSVSREWPHYVRALQLLKMNQQTLEQKNETAY